MPALLALLALASVSRAAPLPATGSWAPTSPRYVFYRALAQAQRDRIFDRLVELCDGAGHRLAGSPGQKRAEEIGAAWLRADGLTVKLDPVKVPVWVRGEESLQLLGPRPESLDLLALGGSVGTPEAGIEAPIVVVRDFSELGPQVKGRIVVYNHPMGGSSPAIAEYGPAVAYRGSGASRAAEFGAVGVLVRSVTANSLSTPHTGAMGYDAAWPKIPAAAITTEDADRLERLASRGEVRVRLRLGAHTLPDADAVNVIGELRGTERPDEIVVIGGHLDSWDVGQGASDDGAGIVESVEALRLLAKGGAPRRTVRVVLFANEENGLRGGLGYSAAHGGERHVAAIESDLGGGGPRGWGVTATPEQRAWLEPGLAGSGMETIDEGGGADISPLTRLGVLSIGLLPDHAHYFDVHHTRADTVDKIDPAALADSTAALAALLEHVANAPDAPAYAPRAEAAKH
jgi:hypothetical protein